MFLAIYVKLFNMILDTGHMPNSWLEGTIYAIYKNKGDRSDPYNYRPITLLSCFGKLFTSILNERLNKFLESNEILNENQAGFRKNHSCLDHIFVLQSLIETLCKNKKKLFSLYRFLSGFRQSVEKWTLVKAAIKLRYRKNI